MFGIHYSVTNRLIAVVALLLWFGLSTTGAGQTDAAKTDATATGAPKAEATNSNAAKLDAAGTESVKPGEPTDPKARKTFASAIDWERHGHDDAALDDFRKANKQDSGHCWECLWRAYRLAVTRGQYQVAIDIARDWLPVAQSDVDKATVHFRLGIAQQDQGVKETKEKALAESSDEFKAVLALDPKLTLAHFNLGISLARLHRDDAAREEFSAFLKEDRSNPSLHKRAERYLQRIELARATMAPPFSVTTLDGQRVSMDSLEGKVVLIDFWATWCGDCVIAMPHIRKIAQKFQDQPLVVLSVSLDSDEGKWKDFVAKNGMTWLQYRDGGSAGQIAKQFGITEIPATFSIDADGVLEDQHVGDADIEGKLKKMIARAVEVNNRKSEPVVVDRAPGAAN